MNELPLSSDLFITDYKLTSVNPAWSARSASGKVLSRTQDYQYFEGSVTVFCRTRKAVRQLQAFVAARQGVVVPFYLRLPDQETLETISGNPRVNGTYTAKSDHLELTGYRGVLSAGDKFTIDNDSKVYTLLNDSPEQTTVYISPRLQKPVVNLSAITLDPKYYCRLKSDQFSFSMKDTTHSMKIKLEWEEVL